MVHKQMIYVDAHHPLAKKMIPYVDGERVYHVYAGWFPPDPSVEGGGEVYCYATREDGSYMLSDDRRKIATVVRSGKTMWKYKDETDE